MAETTQGTLVHIGYPKCASTYLQRVVFPGARGLYTERAWEGLAFDRFVLTDRIDYNARQTAADFAVKARETSSEDRRDAGRITRVISCENLVCGASAQFDFSEAVADRLSRTFPDARILIVVREQRSMVLSLYRQLVRRGESHLLREAIASTGAPGHYPRLRIDRLRYHDRFALYADRFGPDRVLLLPYESLVDDESAFVSRALDFATGLATGGDDVRAVPKGSEPANVGYRGLTLELRRRINGVAAESSNGPGGPPRSFRIARKATSAIDRVLPASAHARLEATYRSTVADVVGDRFAESNRVLAERTGLDLGALGYAV